MLMIIRAADVIPVAGVVCLSAATIILWSKPSRTANQILAALYLFLVTCNAAIVLGINGVFFPDLDEDASFLRWRRVNAAVMAFFPFGISLLKSSLSNTKDKFSKQHLQWLAVGASMLSLCFHRSFIYFDTNSGEAIRGISYLLYGFIGSASFLVLCFQFYYKSKRFTGLQVLEINLAGLNFSAACFLTIAVTNIGNLLQFQPLRRSIFFIFPASAILSAWAMTSSRLYDPRQIFLGFAQRAIVTIILALGAAGLWHYYRTMATLPVDLLLFVGLWSGAAFWLDRRSREWLDLDGGKALAEIRQEIIEIALKEGNSDQLALSYEVFLAKRFQTDFALLLFDRGASYCSKTVFLGKNRSGIKVLYETGWATPESLERCRTSRASTDLQLFILQNSIGVLSVSPISSREPSLILALGRKKRAWAFTYPEIKRLQNVGELIDNVLSRSRLAMQATAQARVEHLAMMSRGLAHDLKNLITPVSSFLIHTDTHFPPNSPGADVHSAARRSVRIMTDYVREALFFSERLEPRFEPVDIEKLFSDVAEITASRAVGRKITVNFQTGDHGPLTADSVLLQRVLSNLVSNAIDASSPGKEVNVSVVSMERSIVRFQVTDAGNGIAPENISKIFDPYFTTKKFGDDIRGFGLGLTICQKIVQLHRGTISVESELNHGTIVSVDFPLVRGTQRPVNRLLTKAEPSATGKAR